MGVVVGFDGSEQSILALHYAARAAQRRNSVLAVINKFTVPTMIYTTYAALPDTREDQLRQQLAEETLEAARCTLNHVVHQLDRGTAFWSSCEVGRCSWYRATFNTSVRRNTAAPAQLMIRKCSTPSGRDSKSRCSGGA